MPKKTVLFSKYHPKRRMLPLINNDPNESGQTSDDASSTMTLKLLQDPKIFKSSISRLGNTTNSLASFDEVKIDK